jgi:FkbM family methyltransferase
MNLNLLYKTYTTLFARKSLQPFNKLLFNLSLRGLGVLNYQNSKLSGEHYLINKLLKNYSIDTLFDVGANVGNYTKDFHQNFPDCQIYCFEPHPKTFSKLIQNLPKSDKLNLFNIGFSDVSCQSVIYDYKHNAGSSHASLYEDVIKTLHHEEVDKFSIELATIDDFVSQSNISKISMLKIDTEGNEMKVLAGAQKTLQANIIDIIHIEFNEMNVISQVFMKNFVDLLTNYNLYRLLPNGLIKVNYVRPVEFEIFAYQNIIAFRKDIDKKKV